MKFETEMKLKKLYLYMLENHTEILHQFLEEEE